MNFNAKEVKDRCVKWIREWFEENGDRCKAVIGISGGVDSSVVAALCVEALGKERVYGVLMPQNSQDDIDYSYELCEHLGIEHCVIDIGNTVEDMLTLMYIKSGIKVSNQTEINIPARVRMVMLYAISQSIDGRVANTCNLSENYVGYSTKYGDAAGDFSPLEDLTKTEVKAIGKELGLPERLVNKVPTDGLCGKTDEENFGFSYDMLDKYIRTGKIDDLPKQRNIECLHMMNEFKMKPMAHYLYKVHAETESGDQIGYLVASRAKEVDGLKAINHDDKVDAVAICALTEDDKMVLIRQYRYAIGSYIYELPAGLVDDGESVCDAAIREMHEETGLTLEITDLPIGNKGGYSSAGMTDETCTLVVGKVTGEISDKYKEASEEIEVLLVDKKEAARILKEENVCIRLALMLMMFIHE